MEIENAIASLQAQVLALSVAKQYDSDYSNNAQRDAEIKRLRNEMAAQQTSHAAEIEKLRAQITSVRNNKLGLAELEAALSGVVDETVSIEKRLDSRIDSTSASLAQDAATLRALAAQDAVAAAEFLRGAIQSLCTGE